MGALQIGEQILFGFSTSLWLYMLKYTHKLMHNHSYAV